MTGVKVVPYGAPDSAKLEEIRAFVSEAAPQVPSGLCVYRYILYTWPNLCFMAMDGEEIVGVVVSAVAMHHNNMLRGGLELLVVKKDYRSCGLGKRLIARAIEALIDVDADEIVVVVETYNAHAISIYERLGFARTKLLVNNYGRGRSSWKMMLLLTPMVEDLWDCSSSDDSETCGCGFGDSVSYSDCHKHEDLVEPKQG